MLKWPMVPSKSSWFRSWRKSTGRAMACIGTDEEDNLLLAAITQQLAFHNENSALWETLANAHVIAMCEMHAKVNNAFFAAAA